jgi:hypothetical protein
MKKITFKAPVWDCMRAFQMPRWVMNSLNLWTKKHAVRVVIRRGKSVIYNGFVRLISGTEVRSGNAVQSLRKGELITVTVFRS